MASKVKCHCGQVLGTSLYEGHNLSILIPEKLTDRSDSGTSANELLDELVSKSSIVMSCPNCKGLTLQLPNGRFQSYVLLED